MYKKKLPSKREANVLKVVVVVLFDYNRDGTSNHYANFSNFKLREHHVLAFYFLLLFF